ncbi:MAG: EF-hand domain-containing protein [Verrucomicrobia bacterium]|nr:EF-hand domain-containing protein [Verrucomicrobiota bacterium]
MKSGRTLLCAALVAGVVLPAGVFAAKADRKGERRNKQNETAAVAFETIDKNKDGFASREEFLEALKTKLGEDAARARFATLDRNADGKLSKDEYGTGEEPKKKRRKKDAK